MRESILARLRTMGEDPVVELKHLFSELDYNNTNRLR
jgi:hypothetical protein